jgi:hypothetical protein
MRRLMRITRVVAILFGGFVSLVGLMSLVGLATDNFWVRFVAAVVVLIALPALVADRLLKRMNMGGGLGMVGDVFAISFLAIGLVFMGTEVLSKGMFVREGDRYARSGSRVMARVAYFLGGASPVFPEERGANPAGTSAWGSASAHAVGSSSGARADAGSK